MTKQDAPYLHHCKEYVHRVCAWVDTQLGTAQFAMLVVDLVHTDDELTHRSAVVDGKYSALFPVVAGVLPPAAPSRFADETSAGHERMHLALKHIEQWLTANPISRASPLIRSASSFSDLRTCAKLNPVGSSESIPPATLVLSQAKAHLSLACKANSTWLATPPAESTWSTSSSLDAAAAAVEQFSVDLELSVTYRMRIIREMHILHVAMRREWMKGVKPSPIAVATTDCLHALHALNETTRPESQTRARRRAMRVARRAEGFAPIPSPVYPRSDEIVDSSPVLVNAYVDLMKRIETRTIDSKQARALLLDLQRREDEFWNGTGRTISHAACAARGVRCFTIEEAIRQLEATETLVSVAISAAASMASKHVHTPTPTTTTAVPMEMSPTSKSPLLESCGHPVVTASLSTTPTIPQSPASPAPPLSASPSKTSPMNIGDDVKHSHSDRGPPELPSSAQTKLADDVHTADARTKAKERYKVKKRQARAERKRLRESSGVKPPVSSVEPTPQIRTDACVVEAMTATITIQHPDEALNQMASPVNPPVNPPVDPVVSPINPLADPIISPVNPLPVDPTTTTTSTAHIGKEGEMDCVSNKDATETETRLTVHSAPTATVISPHMPEPVITGTIKSLMPVQHATTATTTTTSATEPALCSSTTATTTTTVTTMTTTSANNDTRMQVVQHQHKQEVHSQALLQPHPHASFVSVDPSSSSSSVMPLSISPQPPPPPPSTLPVAPSYPCVPYTPPNYPLTPTTVATTSSTNRQSVEIDQRLQRLAQNFLVCVTDAERADVRTSSRAMCWMQTMHFMNQITGLVRMGAQFPDAIPFMTQQCKRLTTDLQHSAPGDEDFRRAVMCGVLNVARTTNEMLQYVMTGQFPSSS